MPTIKLPSLKLFLRTSSRSGHYPGSLSLRIIVSEIISPKPALPIMSCFLSSTYSIKESNLKIPEDISVICFDDHPYLEYIDPVITRIAQPVKRISTLATEILINDIEKEEKNRS